MKISSLSFTPLHSALLIIKNSNLITRPQKLNKLNMKNKVLFLALAILGAGSVKAQLNVGSTSAADPSAI